MYRNKFVVTTLVVQTAKAVTTNKSEKLFLYKPLEWRGPVMAGEPFVYELTFCITQPGQTGFYIQTAVGRKDRGENTLYITSTADSAEVVPSSEHKVHQPPLWSTATPTPEPVVVSPECAGDEQ